MTQARELRVLIAHGYGLEGSGSNQYVRELAERLARLCQAVHVVCQYRGDMPPWVSSVEQLDAEGEVVGSVVSEGGGVRVHRPHLPGPLPVYNLDHYPDFSEVRTFLELSEADLHDYMDCFGHALRRVVTDHRIDVVLVNHTLPLPEVARRYLEGLCPYVVIPHGSAIVYVADRAERYLELAQRGVAGAEGLILGGDEMRERLRDRFPGIRRLVEDAPIVPMGVDLERFHPKVGAFPVDSGKGRPVGVPSTFPDLPRDRLGLRKWINEEALRCPGNDNAIDLSEVVGGESRPWIVFHGRLVTGKGVHVLLAAFALLQRKYPDHELWIVGDGPLRVPLELLTHALDSKDRELFSLLVEQGWAHEGKEHGPWSELTPFLTEERFSFLVEQFGAGTFARRVRFAGFVSQRTVPQLLARAELSVTPSIVAEAYPLVLVEGMALGHLPLTSNIGGVVPLLRELSDVLSLDFGLLAFDSTPKGLVERLAQLVDTRLQREYIPRAVTRRFAASRFSWDSIALRTANVLSDLAQA